MGAPPNEKWQRQKIITTGEWFPQKMWTIRRTMTAKKNTNDLLVSNWNRPHLLFFHYLCVRSAHSRINYLGSFERRRMMFNRSEPMTSDGRNGYTFFVQWSVTFRNATGWSRLVITGMAITVVQTVNVLRNGSLFTPRNCRRLADSTGRDTTDARLAGRSLTVGRIVAYVRCDVMASQHRVYIAIHLHTLRQPDSVHFRHDAARACAPLWPSLVQRIRPAPNSITPPSHFRFTEPFVFLPGKKYFSGSWKQLRVFGVFWLVTGQNLRLALHTRPVGMNRNWTQSSATDEKATGLLPCEPSPTEPNTNQPTTVQELHTLSACVCVCIRKRENFLMLYKKKKKNFPGPWSAFCSNPKMGKQLKNWTFPSKFPYFFLLMSFKFEKKSTFDTKHVEVTNDRKTQNEREMPDWMETTSSVPLSLLPTGRTPPTKQGSSPEILFFLIFI